jgi:uncharacterized protein
LEIHFEKLIRLQKIDIDIHAVNALLEAVPARLESFEQDTLAAAGIVAHAKEKLAANQKKRRDLEGEVKTVREQISKFKRQLNDVKTNKEYTALLKEIEEAQHKIDKIEEDILGEMIAADDVEKEIKAAGARKAVEEARIQAEKQSVQAEQKSLEARQADLERERNAILPDIPPEEMKLYDRISRRLLGVALSPITDDFCSLCQMRVRPQMLNEILEMKQVILCEACGRILYIPKPPIEQASVVETIPIPEPVIESVPAVEAAPASAEAAAPAADPAPVVDPAAPNDPSEK